MSAPAAPEPLSEAFLLGCREIVTNSGMILTRTEQAQLLDEITRLRAEVTRLEEQNKWHPASEPPSDDRTVLVFNGFAETRDDLDYMQSSWCAILPDGGPRLWTCDSHYTHWRELPAPPAEG